MKKWIINKENSLWSWLKKQGITVILQSLNGNKTTKKIVSNLTAELLYNDTGLNIVLEMLDAVFQSEETDNVYFAYSKFFNFKQQQNLSLNDAIIELENLNYKMKWNNMKLPDKVLDFKLLEGVSISENQR